MYNVFLLTRPGDAMTSLAGQIDRAGLSCRAGSDVMELEDVAHTDKLDVVLLDLSAVGIGAQSVIERVSQLSLPTLLVMDETAISQYDPAINPDDFIVAPLAPANWWPGSARSCTGGTGAAESS